MKSISNIKFVLLLFLLTSSFLLAEEITSAENFTLKDYNGKSHSLTDYKSSKAIVVMFMSTRCPVSNAYNSRIAELNKNYAGKGISFLGINSNKQEDAGEVKKHANEHGLDFVILKDPGNKIADKFEASFTPEIYVLNSDFKVLYHGRIDDSKNEDDVSSKDLENALNEILGGKDVTVSKTKAFGCSIKRVE